MLVQVQRFREELKFPQAHLHRSSIMKPQKRYAYFQKLGSLLDLHIQFRAQQLNKSWTGEAKQTEDVFEALGRSEIGALFVEDMNDPVRVQIVEIDQEFIRVHNGDIERGCCLFRKVARIKGDDRLASAANCSGKNMPVFLVVGH